MKTMSIFFIFSIFIALNIVSYSQIKNIPDSSGVILTQYRRGVELPDHYQTYEQKYLGKNLSEEKRRAYPLGKVMNSTGIWTELNPKVPRVDYLGIYFVNTDTGWACGDLGTIIKTTDGGDSWVVEETNTTTPILKVRSYDGAVVIASGFDGMILRSTDGGESWAQVTSNLTGDLWGLQMINDSLGWVCGNYNSLAKTTDGGQIWTRVFTPGYTGNYWWIDFLTKNYGFIAADGYVLRTADGGDNWEIIPAGDSYPLFCIDVIDSLHIAAAGYGGIDYPAKNIYSSDGGNTWTNGGELQAFAVNCIRYLNADTGYLSIDETGLWKTTNRGQSWTIVDSLVSLYMGEYEFQLFKQENIGYDAGSSLRIYKSEGNFDNWHKSIINDDFSDIFFTGEQKGFVISSGLIGRVYRTTDGGMDWQPAPGPSGFSLLFTDSLTGYLGSTSIWKTIDGGNSWYETNSPNTYGSINKIFFTKQQMGWYITSGGAIFNTLDGGEDWTQQYYNPSVIYRSVYFIDSLNGWTANLGARPYKTTNGGTNWIQQTILEIYQSRDIFFINHQNGFLLESNKLYQTTDGGDTFNLIPGITGYSVAAKFSNYGDSTIFITGYKTYRSLNGGGSWYQFPELDLIRICRLSLLNSGSGYAGGDMGLIFRYYDPTYTPVALISFSSKIIGNNVSLTWTTATETNNKGFEIERHSAENKVYGNTSKDWERIGFVEGNGTSSEVLSYSYTDKNPSPGIYIYRLKQIDYDGSVEYSNEVKVEVTTSLVFSLDQNYPNPFNAATKIRYSIPFKGFVRLVIYDVLGKEVTTLVNEEKPEGKYTVEFNGEDLSSGVYMYRLIYRKYSLIKKLILLK